MHKVLIALTLTTAACSIWQKKPITLQKFPTPIKKEIKPFITEVTVSDPNDTTITKKVIIHNPLRIGIRVVVQCDMEYQDELVLDIDPRRVKFAWVGAHASQERISTCQLIKYQAH